MLENKTNWNSFRDDAAVKFFAAMLSNDTLVNKLNNNLYSMESLEDTLTKRAYRYANKLTKTLKENKFEEEK